MALDVAEKLPDICFILMGGPGQGHEALFESVRSRARSMSNVEVIGFTPFEHTDEYYRRASLLLCTSTVEGFPNTFLQAWDTGAVVVSTYDPDEVLTTEHIGFHCSDVECIVDTIRSLAHDPLLREDVAARARAHLASRHSPEAVIPRLDALLRRVVSPRLGQ